MARLLQFATLRLFKPNAGSRLHNGGHHGYLLHIKLMSCFHVRVPEELVLRRRR